MNIEELVDKADRFYRDEIRKYNPDVEVLHDLVLDASIRLAKKYGANENIVKIAISMMDSKLQEAIHLGMVKQHIQMAVDATKELIKDEECLSKRDKENIIKCVEQHHGAESFFSIESEVCANADSYQFVSPKGFLFYSSMLGRRFHDFTKELEQLNFKLNEKHNVLSLPMAKEELEEYYQCFQKAIDEAKKNN